MNTPILFLIFNRPENTKLAFDVIKKQAPEKLYVAADGPRADKPGEKEKCEITRKVVLENIDWDCEVKTLLRTENLGCGRAVSQGITWFFDHEEKGIILEDDCIPDTSFFGFCSDLLKRYANEEKVMMITGCSFQKKPLDDHTYYYSQYFHIWGWATWKRAWCNYDFQLNNSNEYEVSNVIKKRFTKKEEQDIWLRNILNAKSGHINTWDYQWMYAMWKMDSLSVVPWKNSISNIGYGADATHTKGFDPVTMALQTCELKDIKHPPNIAINSKADNYIRFKLIIPKKPPFWYFKKILKRLIK